MTRQTKKLMKFGVLGIVLGVVLMAGCIGQNSQLDEDDAVPYQGPQVLKVGGMWEIKSLDPAKSGTLIKEKAMVVENLIEVNPDFTLKPHLATSWEMVNDTTWKIQLWEGVFFHDGSPLTSKEVAWSMGRALERDPTTASLTHIKEIAEDGPYGLLITTDRPYAALPATLAYSKLAVVSPNSETSPEGMITRPIGTGPFVYEELDSTKGQLTVVRNQNYWGESPRLDKIVIRSIPDPSTRSMSLEKGEVDFTCDVSYGDVKLLQNKPGITVEIHPTARLYQLTFRSLNGTQYEDKRVRQSISYGINRKDIATYALAGAASPARGYFLPSIAWANTDINGYNYDPEKAGHLLKEAGWRLNSEGVLEKDGKTFAVTLYTYPQRPGLKPMAEAIQSDLKALGIEVDVRVMDWSAIKEAQGSEDMKLSAYAMAMVPDPDYYLRRTFYKSGAYNSWDYSNPEVDSLLEEGLTTFNEEKRQKIYSRVQEIVMDEVPVVPVAYYSAAVVMADYVKGFEFNPTAHDYMLNPEMYIEKGGLNQRD